MKSLVVAIMMWCAMGAWGQTFTKSAKGGNNNVSTFNAKLTGVPTSITTSSGDLVCKSCTCSCVSQVVTNVVYLTSTGQLMDGGNYSTSCGVTLNPVFSFTTPDNSDFLWNTQAYANYNCGGQNTVKYVQGLQSNHFQLVKERSAYNGSVSGCYYVGSTLYCNQGQMPWCYNTANPSLNVAVMAAAEMVGGYAIPGFDHIGHALRTSTTSPWSVFLDFSNRNMSVPLPKGWCTVLP